MPLGVQISTPGKPKSWSNEARGVSRLCPLEPAVASTLIEGEPMVQRRGKVPLWAGRWSLVRALHL